jgi:nuclear transport factor 2 (NTF2) superfamily protein
MSTPAGSDPPPATAVPRPPLPPFDHDSAVVKIRLAEDAWNSRNPEAVSRAYSPDSRWRNRDVFVNGRDEIVAFLSQKWERELDYRLIKELWAFTDHRIAVRFVYECHDASGRWFRCHGNENWEFNEDGLMTRRHASINDQRIEESERKYHWDAPGPRPPDHPGLTELDL